MGLLSLGVSMLAPKIGREIIEQGASRVIAKQGANRLTSFIAGKEGQALVSKVGGARIASALASPRGQLLTSYAAKSKIGHTLRGTGNYGSGGTQTNVVNPNVPTPTYNNLVQPTGNSAFTQRGPGQGIGGGGQGFGGTGKGWFQLNDQVTGAGAEADPTKMGDFSVARGPSRYAMMGAGLGTRTLARIGAGVRDSMTAGAEPGGPAPMKMGPRGQSPSTEAAPKVSFPSQVGTNPEAAQQGPIRRARVVKNRSGPETEHNSRTAPTPGAAMETVPFGGTYRPMGTQIGSSTTPGQPRLDAFGDGSAPLALNPGPGPKPYTGGMGGSYMEEVYGGGGSSEHADWASAAQDRIAHAVDPANKIPRVDTRLEGSSRYETQVDKYNAAWKRSGTSMPSVYGR
jgi:hypothetical protein